jgi:transcriptional regulator with PAS, ATPase and Fis domain
VEHADARPAHVENSYKEQAVVAVDREALAAASAALGLSHKTVSKLFGEAELAALHARRVSERWSDEQARYTLTARARERLVGLLSAHGFDQSAVAAELRCSRTTLVKLQKELGVQRAADTPDDAIALALDRSGGDLAAAAAQLRVSPRALAKRLGRARPSGTPS